MPAKGKGKRKVTTGPMDPRKTREPVTGHPDGDVTAALDSVMLSPPHTDNGYDSDTSVVTTTTTAPPPAVRMIPASALDEIKAKFLELSQQIGAPELALTNIALKVLSGLAEALPYAMWLIRELADTLHVDTRLDL